MNYVEFWLGDHMRVTAHLTMIEDAAYRRLLDAYYVRERALPADLRECCKLARAASKHERNAVEYILKSFFELREDGYHQRRADAEIERYQGKRLKAKASAGVRWNTSERNANAMPTHSDGNALHSPVPIPQSPYKESENQSGVLQQVAFRKEPEKKTALRLELEAAGRELGTREPFLDESPKEYEAHLKAVKNSVPGGLMKQISERKGAAT
jgi:uncharacterized protein YdaU (DUF1376 family)